MKVPLFADIEDDEPMAPHVALRLSISQQILFTASERFECRDYSNLIFGRIVRLRKVDFRIPKHPPLRGVDTLCRDDFRIPSSSQART